MIWLFVLLFLNNYCAISSNIDIDLTKKLLKKFNPEKPVENEKKSIFNNCWEWWECTTHVGTLRKMGLDRIQACTWDLSTIFSALPTGTLMRDFCPISCRDPECGFLGDKNKRVSESRQNSTEKPDLEAAPINFNHSDKSKDKSASRSQKRSRPDVDPQSVNNVLTAAEYGSVTIEQIEKIFKEQPLLLKNIKDNIASGAREAEDERRRAHEEDKH